MTRWTRTPSRYDFLPAPHQREDGPPAVVGVDFDQAPFPHPLQALDPLTVFEGWRNYLHEHVIRNGQNAERVAISARYTCEIFGMDALVEKVKRAQFAAYADQRYTEGVAHTTVRKELTLYRAMSSHNHKWDRIAAVPYVQKPRGESKKRRPLTEDEYRRVMALPLTHRFRLFMLLAYWTGHRSRAIETLKWDRVHFDTRTIDFNEPGMRLTNKRRVDGYPMSDELCRRLAAAKARADERCPEDPYVIGLGNPRDGKTPASTYHEAKRSLARIGVNEVGVVRHSIRKLFVTERIKAGKNPEKVAALIGDNAQTMRKHYLQLQTDDLRTAL